MSVPRLIAMAAVLLSFSLLAETTGLTFGRGDSDIGEIAPVMLDYAPALDANEEAVALAARVLREAREFQSAAVGYSGTQSTYAMAWRLLLRSPKAEQTFREVLAIGTTPGQLYGLLGLRVLNRDAYRIEAARVRGAGGTVQTLYGCVGRELNVADIVDAMGKKGFVRDMGFASRR